MSPKGESANGTLNPMQGTSLIKWTINEIENCNVKTSLLSK